MPTQASSNYPDVFGYITDSERSSVDSVQIGVATRPSTVLAGRPFEVIILIQNAFDCHVDVAVTLRLPVKDAAGAKGCFTAAKDRLVVGLEPAEVGYITLPIAARSNTTPGDGYNIGVEVVAKLVDKKARRIRAPGGGGRFNPARVSKKMRQQLDELKKVKFAPQPRKKGPLQVPFSVGKGKAEKTGELKPGWIVLWSLSTQRDSEPLLDKYGELFRLKVLPGLKRQNIYQPLLEKTNERFTKAGYALTEVEAATVTRLLVALVELANTPELVAQCGPPATPYNVQSIIGTKRLPGQEDERALPRWTISFLQGIAKDERIIRAPGRAVAFVAYDDLLIDALLFSLQMIERASGESLGTPEEMNEYAAQVMRKLAKTGELTFADVYLPLVIGGILVTDLVLLKDERINEVMRSMVSLLEHRRPEESDDNEYVFALTGKLLENKLRQYGTLDGGR